MEKQTVRPAHIRRRHILARLLLSAAAVVILLPVVLTALYSFFFARRNQGVHADARQLRREEPDGNQALAQHVFPQPVL